MPAPADNKRKKKKNLHEKTNRKIIFFKKKKKKKPTTIKCSRIGMDQFCAKKKLHLSLHLGETLELLHRKTNH
jgi:hypothetical protein